MSEAIFPFFGVAFVMVVVLPVSALVAKLVLRALDRSGGPLHGLNARFLVLTGSTLAPLAWLLSAALHQAETSRSIVACLLHDDVAGACFEAGLFALLLGLILFICLVRASVGTNVPGHSGTERAKRALLRIDRLMASSPLAWVRGRVAVTEAPGFAAAVTGLLRPSILIGASYVEDLDDDPLAGALAHEAEHLRSRDPLRYWLLRFALAANPLGSCLLASEASSWVSAREAHCDREAVLGGAGPLPLAAAIIAAARPASADPAVGARDARVLRFRVELLCAFAESPPRRCCPGRVPPFAMSLAMLVFAAALPHQLGTEALDLLHRGAEEAATLFLP